MQQQVRTEDGLEREIVLGLRNLTEDQRHAILLTIQALQRHTPVVLVSGANVVPIHARPSSQS